MTKKYGYLYGNPKRLKFRSPWFQDKFQRDLHARADKDNGFRVRTYESKDKPNPRSNHL